MTDQKIQADKMQDKAAGEQENSSYLRRKLGSGFSLFLVFVGAIAFYFLLFHLGKISEVLKTISACFKPIWFGCAFAYLFNPFMKWAERHVLRLLGERFTKEKRKKIARGVGIFFSLGLFVVIVVLLFNMILPDLYRTIHRLIAVLPRELNNLMNTVNNIDPKSMLGKYGQKLAEKMNESFQTWLRSDFLGGLDNVMEMITTGLINTVSTTFYLLVGLIVSVYLLAGKEKFAGQAKKILYALFRRERANYVLSLSRRSNQIFTNFIVGKIIDSVIIGILCYIGMSIFNISDRYTLLVSIFVGVTNVIPFFGPYIGAIPSALLIFLEDPLHGVYFLIFVLVLQQFDGNILGPKILGDSTGLSAFWVIFAILGFGGMFGFIGMILGVPTFAVIYYLIKSFVNEKLLKQGLPTETEEFMSLTGVSEDGKLCQNETENDTNNEGTQVKIWIPGFLRKMGKHNRKE